MPFHLPPTSFKGEMGSPKQSTENPQEHARVASIIKRGSYCSAASKGAVGHSCASKVSGGVRL